MAIYLVLSEPLRNFWAGTIKGGVNYNIDDDYNNVFINAGFISRAPFFSGGAFLNSTVSNATNPDAVNEKIASIEAGYGFQSNSFKATINAYFTKWMDKTMAKTGEYTMDDGTQDHYMVNMEGVDAVHEGIEIELVANLGGYAVGAFNVANYETALAVLKAAEAEKQPVIISLLGNVIIPSFIDLILTQFSVKGALLFVLLATV